jgi:hypothetical protein
VRPGSREENIARLVRRFLPAFGQRLADRRCSELDGNRVVSSNRLAFQQWLARAYPGTLEDRYAHL